MCNIIVPHGFGGTESMGALKKVVCKKCKAKEKGFTASSKTIIFELLLAFLSKDFKMLQLKRKPK